MLKLFCLNCGTNMDTDGDEFTVDNISLLMVLECPNPACGKEFEVIDINPIVLQEVDPEERDYAQDRSDEIDDLLKGEDRDEEEE